MTDSSIPTLTDLIEKGIEIRMEELGLDDDPEFQDTVIDITEPDPDSADIFQNNPALEQTIRRILDEHVELAWQEIRLAIQRELDKS